MGLEAASRGAAAVVMVDSARQAVDAARQNVSALALPRVTVVLSSVQRFLDRSSWSTASSSPSRSSRGTSSAAGTASLVFADPPYELSQLELSAMLELLVSGEWLEPDALVVVERSSRALEPQWPQGLIRRAIRRYGDTAVWEAEWTQSPPR
jgi:16S rRNA (guanine966-N2)-methyltransferase